MAVRLSQIMMGQLEYSHVARCALRLDSELGDATQSNDTIYLGCCSRVFALTVSDSTPADMWFEARLYPEICK